jgi:SAM-dependent methyltransferase
MSVFDAYAAYYDLLYRDKDYAGEAAYVHGLLQRHAPGVRDVLELGCGTGGHAVEMARYGYNITGVDLSSAMVERAEARTAALPPGTFSGPTPRPRFTQGDLRDYSDGRQYGAVLALFHVMSYQTTNADLRAAMANAAANLAPDGVLVFDCWYGPGVLTDPPVRRVRRLQGDEVTITRIAEPAHFPNENRVDVHYEVLVEGPTGAETIRETHPMRYLFVPEIDLLLESAGMNRLEAEEWVTGADPAISTWNICIVAGRQKND